MLGNFSAMTSVMFSTHLCLSSPSETPIMQILVPLMFSQRSLKNTIFLFIFLKSLFSVSVFCYSIPPHRLVPLCHLILFPSSVFSFAFVVLFIFGCSLCFLTHCQNLLNYLLCASILLLNFLFTFVVTIMNSFLDRLPMSTSLIILSRFLYKQIYRLHKLLIDFKGRLNRNTQVRHCGEDEYLQSLDIQQKVHRTFSRRTGSDIGGSSLCAQ